jgi:predicted nucleotidyltransferase
MIARAEIEAAIEDLVDDLIRQDVAAVIYLVGGTALMLGFDARQATRDVDAVVTPRDRVLATAREVARRRDLPDDWLNASAANFVPPHPEDPHPTLLISRGGVRVEIASAEMLLAMKIRASRGRQDIDDIRFLLRVLDVRTIEDALSIYERVYEEDPLPARARPILNELLDSQAPQGR